MTKADFDKQKEEDALNILDKAIIIARTQRDRLNHDRIGVVWDAPTRVAEMIIEDFSKKHIDIIGFLNSSRKSEIDREGFDLLVRERFTRIDEQLQKDLDQAISKSRISLTA